LLSRTLFALGGYLGLANEEVRKENPELSKQFVSLKAAIDEFRKRMLEGDDRKKDKTAHKLAQFQKALFEDIRDTFKALQNQDTSGPLRVEDLPRAIRDRFIGVSGKYLLMVYPKKDVWQRESQEEFIRDLTKVDPNVTGTPVQLFYYTDLLKKSYEEAARYSLIAITLLVLNLGIGKHLASDEIAAALNISRATVKRDWATAKLWLRSRLSG